jgi:tetratricopeptide (TPR) repeat protein
MFPEREDDRTADEREVAMDSYSGRDPFDRSAGPADVFISYSRRSNSEPARDLYDALVSRLGKNSVFLDTEAIETGTTFPDELREAMLNARVFVALVDETYFERWYCRQEWDLACLLLSNADVANAAQRGEAVEHLVVALPSGSFPDSVDLMLPPTVRRTNLPQATATEDVVGLVIQRRNLDRLGKRFAKANIRNIADRFLSETAPPARRMCARTHPASFPRSLTSRFVGRTDDLWRLHKALLPPGQPGELAPRAAAVTAGAGIGKTTLALEYIHRYAAVHFSGGVFWIDAEAPTEAGSQSDEAAAGQWIARQQHSILSVLDSQTPLLENLREPVADLLARKLSNIPRECRVLFVVDHVPEPKAGVRPPPLRHFCPAPDRVTVLATSRRPVGGITPLDPPLSLLKREASIELLQRDADVASLNPDGWNEIADLVGDLPIALELLAEVMHADYGDLTPTTVLNHLRSAETVDFLDERFDALREELDQGARIKGVGAAFKISYDRLGKTSQRAARVFSWLAPAVVPDVLVSAISSTLGQTRWRSKLSRRSMLQPAASPVGARAWQMQRLLASFLRRAGRTPLNDLAAALSSVAAILTPDSCQDHQQREILLECLPAALRVSSLAATHYEETEQAHSLWRLIMHLEEAVDRLRQVSAVSDAWVASVELCRYGLRLVSRTKHPVDWALTQNKNGRALFVMGRFERSSRLLEDSEAACRAALEVLSVDFAEHQTERARIQRNLGNSLCFLGGLECNTDQLEASIQSYRDALDIFELKNEPDEWAKTQNGLGNAMIELGRLECPAENLGGAAQAYREALVKRSRERDPAGWATTQNNLAVALVELGLRENSKEHIEKAVQVFRLALEEWTRERMPLYWATAQSNLGAALTELGRHENSEDRLKEAVEACRAALKEWTRDHVPSDWAEAQSNLGRALFELGRCEGSVERVVDSVETLHEALEERNREREPYEWAETRAILALALAYLGSIEIPAGDCKEARRAIAETLVTVEQLAPGLIGKFQRLDAEIEQLCL